MNTLNRTLLVLLFASPAVFAAGTASTTLVSKSTLGNSGNNHSQGSSIAMDNKTVAFESKASNLVVGDSNLSSDIFVSTNGKLVQRASINTLGFEARDGNDWNGSDERADSWAPVIAVRGSPVVFVSRATNLDLETITGTIIGPKNMGYNISQDTNGVDDIFVRDLVRKRTYRISGRMTDCTATPKSCTVPGAFRVTTETTDDSGHPAISADAHFIAYTTKTDSKTISDNAQGVASDISISDVFVNDFVTHRTELISAPHDTSGNATGSATMGADSDYAAVSPDGRLVVFTSTATNLVAGDVSDTGNDADVFAYDRMTRTLFRISGAVSGGAVTAEANGESFSNRYSVAGAKGRYFVAFHSKATNLDSVPEMGADDDVFVADLQTNTGTQQLMIAEIRRVSGVVDVKDGKVTEEANGVSRWPAIAAVGTTYAVSFESEADNILTPTFFWQEDSNGEQDIYTYDRKTKLVNRTSLNFEGIEVQASSAHPAMSPDGKVVAFDSQDPYMVLLDINQGVRDVFVKLR